MKVMCIHDNWVRDNGKLPPKTPEFGELYSVVGEGEAGGYWYYALAGYEGLWEARAFVPVSDIDETEMVRNYDKVSV